jgi:gas vesicle protein
MSNDSNSILETALTFAIGVAAGCVLGILFAPARGQKTRHNIQKEIDKAGEVVKDNFDKITKEAGKSIEALAGHFKS